MTDGVPCRGNVLGRYVSARYILVILGSIAMAIVYGSKVILSVAMVAMLNHTAFELESDGGAHNITPNMTSNMTTIAHGADECGSDAASGVLENGPFNWNEPLQGTILSSYFWGYLVSQIPGALVAEKFSAKYVMLFSVAINVVCTILTPIAAKFHYIAMILLRIVQGIGGGVTFPAMHVMLAAWAPTDERSTMSALVYAGTSLGTGFSMLLAGLLAGTFGWESVFYVMGFVMGFISAIWIVLWVYFVQDTPSKQPLISQEERNYINSSLGSNEHEEVKPPVPWRRVFTSLPFLAILVAHTCSNWGWYTLLIETSFYFKQVLHFNIKENAIVSAVPFLTMWFFSMFLSKTLDSLRAGGKISTASARKLSTLIASAIPMICLFALCYIGCRRTLAVFLMGVGITSIGGMFCGFLSNHIDIAPNYAGTLMAITNTAATLPGIIMPLFVGAVTYGNQTISAWRVIFFGAIALYIIGMIVYTLFGSDEEQSWNQEQANELVSIAPTEAGNTPLGQNDNQNDQTSTHSGVSGGRVEEVRMRVEFMLELNVEHQRR